MTAIPDQDEQHPDKSTEQLRTELRERRRELLPAVNEARRLQRALVTLETDVYDWPDPGPLPDSIA
jgi:uncharacterized membrane protein